MRTAACAHQPHAVALWQPDEFAGRTVCRRSVWGGRPPATVGRWPPAVALWKIMFRCCTISFDG